MFTYPLIGNYGVSGENFQSDHMWPGAMVCKGGLGAPYPPPLDQNDS